MGDDFLTPDELVVRWKGRITKGTLSNWRHKGRGPAYQKIGARVLYPLRAVVVFEQSNFNDAKGNYGNAKAV